MNTIIKQSYQLKNFSTDYEDCRFAPQSPLTVIYVHGLLANPWARKGNFLKKESQRLGVNYFRFELIGHGVDQANFKQADFELWKQQLSDIITNYVSGKIILVGHCIGAWLSLCIAEKFPERIVGLLCLAAVPNLTDQLLKRASVEQRQTLEKTGIVKARLEKCCFTFTRKSWEAFEKNNLLRQETININCPVHLFHGLQDIFVDWHAILPLAAKMSSQHVIVKILKFGNHHLNDTTTFNEIKASLQDIMAHCQK